MAEDSSISVVIDPNPSDSISKRSSSRFVSLSLVPKDFTSTKNDKPAAVGSEPSDTSSERECYSGDVSPHSCDFETAVFIFCSSSFSKKDSNSGDSIVSSKVRRVVS